MMKKTLTLIILKMMPMDGLMASSDGYVLDVFVLGKQYKNVREFLNKPPAEPQINFKTLKLEETDIFPPMLREAKYDLRNIIMDISLDEKSIGWDKKAKSFSKEAERILISEFELTRIPKNAHVLYKDSLIKLALLWKRISTLFACQRDFNFRINTVLKTLDDIEDKSQLTRANTETVKVCYDLLLTFKSEYTEKLLPELRSPNHPTKFTKELIVKIESFITDHQSKLDRYKQGKGF